MPDPEFQKLFIVTGLALGGVYALSGVGMVVLYRATGVLNLAFGAVGALGALISWQLLQSTGTPNWLAYLVCVAFGGAVTLAYGLVFGPLLAPRDPLVKAIGTVGLLLIFLGIMQWKWGQRNGLALTLPTSGWRYTLPGGLGIINWTQIIGMSFGILVTAGTAAARRGGRVARIRARLRRRRSAALEPARAEHPDPDVLRHLRGRRGADRPAAVDLGDARRRDRDWRDRGPADRLPRVGQLH